MTTGRINQVAALHSFHTSRYNTPPPGDARAMCLCDRRLVKLFPFLSANGAPTTTAGSRPPRAEASAAFH